MRTHSDRLSIRFFSIRYDDDAEKAFYRRILQSGRWRIFAECPAVIETHRIRFRKYVKHFGLSNFE